jgi:hypothetical protein
MFVVYGMYLHINKDIQNVYGTAKSIGKFVIISVYVRKDHIYIYQCFTLPFQEVRNIKTNH